MLFPHTPQEERRFQHLRHLGRRLHQRPPARTPRLLVLVAARASVGGRTTLAPAETPARPVGRRGIGLCGLLSSVITAAHSSSGGRTALQPCRHLSGGPGEGCRPGVSVCLPPSLPPSPSESSLGLGVEGPGECQGARAGGPGRGSPVPLVRGAGGRQRGALDPKVRRGLTALAGATERQELAIRKGNVEGSGLDPCGWTAVPRVWSTRQSRQGQGQGHSFQPTDVLEVSF